jgi:hypothetical protein
LLAATPALTTEDMMEQARDFAAFAKDPMMEMRDDVRGVAYWE